MKPKTYWALGVLGVAMIIGAGVFLFEKYIDPAPELLRKPPPGETYTTGHWDGDEWHRTVPPDPETIYIDGKKEGLDYGEKGGGYLTYAELEEKADTRSMPDLRVYGKYAIEHYPYSELAFKERRLRAKRDENGKRIWDSDILVSRYKEMLKWHSDAPNLLRDLAGVLYDNENYTEVIKYGEEALKYMHLYPVESGSAYGTWPEDIHVYLGLAYQEVGDYDAALVHLKAAVKAIEAHPETTTWRVDTFKDYIKHIKAGRPLKGPAYLDPDYLKRKKKG